MNPSTNASESSPDGLGLRPPDLVKVNAGDAIASVAAALISYVLLPGNFDNFLRWYRSVTNDASMTERRMTNDLTNVRETLRDMGYDWP